jgi:hypothetical protein
MSNGIEMLCEMASNDSGWSVSFSFQIGMAFERLKGIVSWIKMTFGQFDCVDGNFLIIRWGILNFKFSFRMLKLKKWKFRRFVHFEVLFIDKYRYGENFFSPQHKILSPLREIRRQRNNICL